MTAPAENLVLPLLAPGRDGKGGEHQAVAEGPNVCPACHHAVRQGEPEDHHGWCAVGMAEIE